MIQGIDHVVVAVKDLDAAIAQYEKLLGMNATDIGEPPGMGFKNAFFRFSDGNALELVCPTDETGPVGRRVASAGEGVYLVALAVDDLSATVKDLRDKGVRLIGDPGPDKPVTGQVFIHPSETRGVLTQLMQKS